jgi:hypothetical protein
MAAGIPVHTALAGFVDARVACVHARPLGADAGASGASVGARHDRVPAVACRFAARAGFVHTTAVIDRASGIGTGTRSGTARRAVLEPDDPGADDPLGPFDPEAPPETLPPQPAAATIATRSKRRAGRGGFLTIPRAGQSSCPATHTKRRAKIDCGVRGPSRDYSDSDSFVRASRSGNARSPPAPAPGAAAGLCVVADGCLLRHPMRPVSRRRRSHCRRSR